MTKMTAFSILWLLLTTLQIGLVQETPAKQKAWFEQHWTEFRYLIYRTTADPFRRDVYVLLDPGAFSEKTLRKLFELVSKRFPTPDSLDVWVGTSLQQVRTPEEIDSGLVTDAGDDRHDVMYPKAVLIRVGGNEVIRYTTGSRPPYQKMKTVVLKGKDPHK